jgi:hypothetical protein
VKAHNFDLGDADKRVIVECKSHTWTESWNVLLRSEATARQVPSAKMPTNNPPLTHPFTNEMRTTSLREIRS